MSGVAPEPPPPPARTARARLRKADLVGAFAGVLLLLATAAAVYLRGTVVDYERGAELRGLTGPVEVWRDSLGVPHLWARTEEDLARALGYIHAQERLWQMELFRRVADGRLSEVLGPDLIDSDRFLRTLGMGRAAEHGLTTLDAATLGILEAYADGVNAWIEHHEGPLPPEFLALHFRPGPWTVRNTLSIGKLMAWDLADWEIGLELQRAADIVGPELASELVPRYPKWGPVILQPGGPAAPGHPRTTGARPLGLDLPRIPEPARALLDAASLTRASNSWVVDGSRTRSGKPILANDPHLALRAPSLWMMAALHGGDIHAVGVTIPGAPAIVLGHTDRVAWGFTNATVDDVDFFIERLHPEEPERYLTPDGWRPLEIEPETIRVKGAAPIVHVVRSTRNGPIVSDVDDRGRDRVLSMRWTGLDPSREYVALLGLNRARSADDVLAALRFFDNPHQNVVFADADGRIGYRMAGRVPVRSTGDGLFPAAGWTGENDWAGYLPPDQHPRLLNPPAGYIVTANNRIAGADYPHSIGGNPAEPFRALRIEQLLNSSRGLSAADAARQQMDLHDTFAERYLPRATAAAREAGLQEAAALLEAWDARATPDSRAAALFYTWYEMLRSAVGEDEYRGARMYFPREALNRILESGGGSWVDDIATPHTESLDELATRSMRRAVAAVGSRRWGELHRTEIRHALASARPLDAALRLSLRPVRAGGSPYTVNVAGYGPDLPFISTHGASMRHVVDLGDPDGAGGFVIPTGQSGVPYSRHYRDQLDLWLDGGLWAVPLERSRAAAGAVARSVLRPGG